MSQTPPKIPTFYRVAFLFIDPLIAGSGVYLHLFDPAFIINSFVPPSIATYNPFFAFLQHQLAAALLMCIILDVFLLRKTNELWIWDPVQSGQLLWDVIMVGSQILAIQEQGRLSWEGIRGDDWMSLGITAGIGLVRVGFLARVGMDVVGNGDGKAKGRKRG